MSAVSPPPHLAPTPSVLHTWSADVPVIPHKRVTNGKLKRSHEEPRTGCGELWSWTEAERERMEGERMKDSKSGGTGEEGRDREQGKTRRQRAGDENE